MSGWIAHCPAKINLGLHVLGRRDDGFHDIVTLFQVVDLWDTLACEPADDLTLAVDPPDAAPSDASNLVLRAARLYGEQVPAAGRRGARFSLTKRIPSGGGLGGGSSNAAGALRLLASAWGGDAKPGLLHEIAASLGSDVPFFLTGGTALGTGRGDRIRPVRPVGERPVLLGRPPYRLATAEVYGALRAPLTPLEAGVTVSRFLVNFAERNDFARITNDLEVPAFEMRPGLVAFRDALLSQGAEAALLSGSGSTVFGLFQAGALIAPVAARMGRSFPDWTLHASRTLDAGIRIERA